MTAALELARLYGEMLTDINRECGDDVAAQYRTRIDTLFPKFAAEAAERERLWVAIAGLSGVAGTAVGACEVSCDNNAGVGEDTITRLRDMCERAADFVRLVRLTPAAGGGK